MSRATRFIRFFAPNFDKAKVKGFDDAMSEFHQISDEALRRDNEGNYADAVQLYSRAQEVLNTTLQTYPKLLNAHHRHMCERQARQIGLRQAYLNHLLQNKQWDSVVTIPTRFTMTQVLQNQASMSRVQRLSGATVVSLALNVDFTQTQRPASPLVSSVPSDRPTIEYVITTEKHCLNHNIDFIINDAKTAQPLWILQTVVPDAKVGLEDTILQRACESMPGDKAAQVRIYKSNNAFNLRLQSLATGHALEQSDQGKSLKDWAPRRFRYGGRQFVWKPDMYCEALFETALVRDLEGSKTGEKEDEIIGGCLCWGSMTIEKHRDPTMKIYFPPGLDQGFVEHCLASTLSRWQRQMYPAADDTAKGKAVLIVGLAGAGLGGAAGIAIGS